MEAADRLGRRAGSCVLAYELINRTRGYEFDGYERTVDSHVHDLRAKIEADRHHPRILETVIGAGYRLGLPRDRAAAAVTPGRQPGV